MLCISVAILNCVGVLANELFDLREAPQKAICLCVELADGCKNDLVGDLHIAMAGGDHAHQGERL